MKKTICTLLSLILLILSMSLCSCETDMKTLAGKTPAQLYRAAGEYVEEHLVNSVTTTTMVGTGKCIVEGKEYEVACKEVDKIIRNPSATGKNPDLQLISETNIQAYGTTKTTRSDMLFIGDEMYLEVDEGYGAEKGYAKISYGEFIKYAYGMLGVENAESESNVVVALADDLFDGVAFRKEGDLYCCTLDIDEEAAAELGESILAMLGLSAATEMTYGSSYMEIYYTPDGRLVKIVSYETAKATIGGIEIELSVVETHIYEFENVPALEKPADTRGYLDITDELRAELAGGF